MKRWSRGPFRVEVSCTLDFAGPVHVGTGERASAETDAPALRGADGAARIPGASVRGALRDWGAREAPHLGVSEEAVARLFGEAVSDEGRQARLRVEDIVLGSSSRAEIRDHVRLDRRFGAAARSARYDREVVYPEDARLRLVYEGDGADDPELLLLRELARVLEEDGAIALGGRSGTGLGAASVRAGSLIWTASERWESPDLSTYLLGRLNGAVTGAPFEPPAPAAGGARPRAEGELEAWSWLRLDLALQFDGPMLVAAPYRRDDGPSAREREDADASFQVGPDGRPLLAGSSLRGALRSHAERVAASCGVGSIAEVLFGVARGESGARGLCKVGEGQLVGEPETVFMQHVAIDRLTGLSAKGLLFATAALASPAFTCSLRARWRANRPRESAAVALLLFTLRDLARGWIPVGSRTTRGYGQLRSVDLLGGALSEVVEGAARQREGLPAGDALWAHPKLAPHFEAWRAELDKQGGEE